MTRHEECNIVTLCDVTSSHRHAETDVAENNSNFHGTWIIIMIYFGFGVSLKYETIYTSSTETFSSWGSIL